MAFETEIQEFIDYYKTLLIIQYVNKPKASAEIGAVSTSIIADGLVYQLQRAFDIETAVGPQLTSLAKYYGLSRDVYLLIIQNDYFEFGTYATPDFSDFFGMRTVALNPNPSATVATYPELLSSFYTLSDGELRFYCLLAQVTNASSSTYKNIKESLFNDFSDRIQVFDNKNMSITLFVPVDLLKSILIALAQKKFFKPACVGISVFAVADPSTLFSFGSYDEPVITGLGFGLYTDVLSGETLSYSDLVTV